MYTPSSAGSSTLHHSSANPNPKHFQPVTSNPTTTTGTSKEVSKNTEQRVPQKTFLSRTVAAVQDTGKFLVGLTVSTVKGAGRALHFMTVTPVQFVLVKVGATKTPATVLANFAAEGIASQAQKTSEDSTIKLQFSNLANEVINDSVTKKDFIETFRKYHPDASKDACGVQKRAETYLKHSSVMSEIKKVFDPQNSLRVELKHHMKPTEDLDNLEQRCIKHGVHKTGQTKDNLELYHRHLKDVENLEVTDQRIIKLFNEDKTIKDLLQQVDKLSKHNILLMGTLKELLTEMESDIELPDEGLLKKDLESRLEELLQKIQIQHIDASSQDLSISLDTISENLVKKQKLKDTIENLLKAQNELMTAYNQLSIENAKIVAANTKLAQDGVDIPTASQCLFNDTQEVMAHSRLSGWKFDPAPLETFNKQLKQKQQGLAAVAGFNPYSFKKHMEAIKLSWKTPTLQNHVPGPEKQGHEYTQKILPKNDGLIFDRMPAHYSHSITTGYSADGNSVPLLWMKTTWHIKTDTNNTVDNLPPLSEQKDETSSSSSSSSSNSEYD